MSAVEAAGVAPVPPKVDPERLGDGRVRMGPQLVAHLLMVGLILAGNAIFFLGRWFGGAR